METILETLCAAALVLTGALVSGGLKLPGRRQGEPEAGAQAQDEFGRDLQALLAYRLPAQEEEEAQAD